MPAKTVDYLGMQVKTLAPTQKHRPAIWENMLGTVYAMNAQGMVKYFDYDYDAAKLYAGVTPSSFPRVARKTQRVRYSTSGQELKKGQLALWITD